MRKNQGDFCDLVKRYDGAAFREIIRRHPRSPEAAEARKRLEAKTPAAS